MLAQPSRSFPKVPERDVVPLPAHLQRRLAAYAVAATGLVTIAPLSQAQIVYTPSNIPLALPYFGSFAYTSFDINNDGVTDFRFGALYRTSCSFSTVTSVRNPIGRNVCFKTRILTVNGQQPGNAVVGKVQTYRNTASALPKGVSVGPSATFVSNSNYMGFYFASYGAFSSGSWLKVQTAYLGLKFMIDGQPHYGWARIRFDYPGNFSPDYPPYFGIFTGSISGYAYEATANKPIIAGQTSDANKIAENFSLGGSQAVLPLSHLGLLAAGAQGQRILRHAPHIDSPKNESRSGS